MFNVNHRWILKLANSDTYIGLDHNSGGYPYKTDFWAAEKFNSFENACKYLNTMKLNYHIIEITGIDGHKVEQMNDYDIELTALKKKHGRE